ncbi:MAG: HlyD family secretion protein [Arenicella sp.]|jgi:HlyD family secretion protein
MVKKKSNNKTIFIIAGIVVVLIAFLAIGKSKGWIGGKKLNKVEIAEVKNTTIVERVSASGKIQPVDEVSISSEVSGEVREITIEEGDSVKRGELLVRIRPDNLQSALDRTVANLNSQRANLALTKARMAQSKAQFLRAKQDYERNKKLFENKVISAAEWNGFEATFEGAKSDLVAAEQTIEAARYTVKSSQASVKDARESLGLTSIYAPMDGIVTKLSVEKGEKVVGTSQMSGTEIMRIADLSRMEVRVDVNENDIIRVSEGDEVEIDVDAYSYQDKVFTGTVTAIANSANETAGISESVTEFEVRILIDPSSYADLLKERKQSPFRPGMTASVDIITEKKVDVLSVPLSAVTARDLEKEKEKANKKDGERGEGRGNKDSKKEDSSKSDDNLKEIVFVVEDGKVKMTEVKTGISDFDNIEILSGVKMGQKIVEGPFIMVSKKLKDGEEVEDKENDKKKEENKED